MRRWHEENGRGRGCGMWVVVWEEGRVSKQGMLAGRVRRIISGPILPKCISVVAPEHIRMCVCVSVAYTRPCDIVATRCNPEIESIRTQSVDATKNHCVDTVRNSDLLALKRIPCFEVYFIWNYILTRMNMNKTRETCLNHNFCYHVITRLSTFLFE